MQKGDKQILKKYEIFKQFIKISSAYHAEI